MKNMLLGWAAAIVFLASASASAVPLGVTITPLDACANLPGATTLGRRLDAYHAVTGFREVLDGHYFEVLENGVHAGSCLRAEYRKLEKDDAFRNFFNRRADETDVIALSLNAIGTFAGCATVAACAQTLLEAISSEVSPWTEPVLLTLGALAAIASGSLGLMALASMAIVGAFASHMASEYKEIARDPPDPNYAEVYPYTDGVYEFDWGHGADANAYLNNTFSALGRLSDNSRCILASLERFQGAAAAGDGNAAAAQMAAYLACGNDIDRLSPAAGDLLLGMPSLLRGLGAPDLGAPGVSPASQQFQQLGELLGGQRPISSVPEPGALLLLGFGVAALGMSRRRAVLRAD